jgi:hypothetical protein
MNAGENLWEILNEIEQKTYKIEGVASVISIVAEQLEFNDSSGSLWLCADVLREKSTDISNLITKAMTANREQQDEINELSKKLIVRGKKK